MLYIIVVYIATMLATNETAGGTPRQGARSYKLKEKQYYIERIK